MKGFGLLLLALGAAACGEGQRPFRMVQFCLANTGEIAPLVAELKNFATVSELPFFDASERAERSLRLFAKSNKKLIVAGHTLHVGTSGPTALGFSAVNFAEAPTQIVIGFTAGADQVPALELSRNVVQRLSKRWRVREVLNARTSGAFPLTDCNR